MSTSICLIDFLLDLAEQNMFNAELRSRPDGVGYFCIKVNFINPAFTRILQKNLISIINVEKVKTGEGLWVTLKFNNPEIPDN